MIELLYQRSRKEFLGMQADQTRRIEDLEKRTKSIEKNTEKILDVIISLTNLIEDTKDVISR